MKYIHLLSKSRPEKDKLEVAVVCGGSIAGLFAARVCANHFKKVVIVEPEKWLTTEEGLEDHHRDADSPKRSRVAQYLAYHQFQTLITSAMEKMFPTFKQELDVKLILQKDIFYIQGVPSKPPSGFPHYSGGVYPRSIVIDRPGFETTLRRLVLRTCQGVEYVNGTVVELVYDENAESNRVKGVKVKLPNEETAYVEGSLVVDATGPFQGGLRWLKSLSKPSHSTSLQDLRISYDPKMISTSCEFELSPKLNEELGRYGFSSCKYMCLPAGGAEDSRRVIIVEKKGNFLYLVCGSYNWHDRVNSVDDIENFMMETNLKQPLPDFFGNMVNSLRNENGQATFMHIRCPQSVHIKYHEADYLPSNFVVLGDALTQLNPITGQGCAKACADSIILNALLEHAAISLDGFLPSTFAKQFFREVKIRTEHLWNNAKILDYGSPSTVPIKGEDRLKAISNHFLTYGRLLFSLIIEDGDVSGVFYRQAAWLDPPLFTVAPWLIRRVAWAWAKQFFARWIAS